MSIGDLGKIDVSSVSKSTQPLSQAPAAIYVISHDDIIRSGAETVPEILRLAPNLQVFQTAAGHYVITARGMNGNAADQAFANKLLVLIDGRSVYTPLFSGVYWDMQGVLPEDIERIEVISGPGATLWGANAVNGVINIITRKAADTQGAYGDVNVGAVSRNAALRYGGSAGADLRYRVYAQAVAEDAGTTAGGDPAHDAFHRVQGGFRVDWASGLADDLTVQGDAYDGTNQQLAAPNEDIAGRNLTLRWGHRASTGATLQVQTYYDRISRYTRDGGGHFAVDTYDVDFQHNLPLGDRDKLVWGGGARASHYRIVGTGALEFAPPRRTLFLANLFAQDTLSLTDTLDVTAGLKLEDDPYAGVSLLPDLRIAWTPNPNTLLWAAVSRAVRSPTPFDEDVVEKLGGIDYLLGSPDFETEKLMAYELGARLQPSDALSFSISAYYQDYHDLRSIEFTPATFVPLYWGNGIRGHSYGVEAWANYRVADWWTLAAGVNLLREHFGFAPGATTLIGTSQIGDDPPHQVTMRSSMNLGHGLTFDADFRAIGALPDPRVPAYAELGGRLGWAVGRHVELSVTAANLLHAHHLEYASGYLVPRSVTVGLRCRF